MSLPRPAKADASDIALLLAIPLDEREFFAHVGKSDWLQQYAIEGSDATARQERLRAVWTDEYVPLVAEPFRELIDRALGLGTDVRTQATLGSLREATTHKPIVILFAHWKGPEILYDDLVPPVEREKFVARVRESDTPLARWLASSFRASGFAQASPDQAPAKRSFWSSWRSYRIQSLVEILRASLGVASLENSATDGIEEVFEHEVTRAARRRDAIDLLFRGLLRPGNRLELFDGLHAKEEVEAAVAPLFQGVLDLTTCTSTILADFIAARRQLRFRVVQFPTAQQPIWAAKSLKSTIELTVQAGLPYLDARILARRELEQALAEVGPPKRFIDRLKLWSET
ncbi:MAG TPA: hypothetical protein VHQ90_00580 [Thermoanaerobaculia bacterium]|nr:hypothetical protein [Thermoanaerobaculia bacterium]